MTFRGTFDHALDAKHRLTVPAKFRAALADGMVLATASETESEGPRAVAIWTPAAYDAFTGAALAGKNPLLPEVRALQRVLFNNSHDAELDSAYRVMIPAALMRYAGLHKEVVVTGSGDCLEIFDRAEYTAYNEAALVRLPELAASLGDTA